MKLKKRIEFRYDSLVLANYIKEERNKYDKIVIEFLGNQIL